MGGLAQLKVWRAGLETRALCWLWMFSDAPDDPGLLCVHSRHREPETLPESLLRRRVGFRVPRSARSQLVPISSEVGGTTTSSCSGFGTSWNTLSKGA